MLTSASSQIILGFVSFIGRTIFITNLNADYLGLNELFTSILYVFSLAELGIGTAITFALYKPLAEGDVDQVRTYMEFFKRTYSLIGSCIIILGIIITPFIHYFVKSDTPIENLEVYFILYLLGVGVTYFYSYKQILLEADQKKYIVSLIICFAAIIQIIIQSILIIVYKSYSLYIVVFFFCNIGKNIVLAEVANIKYPFLKGKESVVALSKEKRKSLIRNIKAMFIRKVGEISIGSIDNILISSFVGLSTLGLYANYQIILEALRSALRVFYSSITASIGNLCALESKDRAHESFITLNFINSILFSYITVVIIVLLQPGITMWLGTNYLLKNSTVFLIAINFYLTGSRQMVLNYHSAYGLFWSDKYNPITRAIINLVISLLLVKRYGINGVLLGTTISIVSTGIWIEPYVVYKYGFNKPLKPYFIKYFHYLLITILIATITYFSTFRISLGRFWTFWVKLIFCLLLPPFCYWLFFRKNPDFRRLLLMIRYHFVSKQKHK